MFSSMSFASAISRRAYSAVGGISKSSTAAVNTSSGPSINANVTGLSNKCVKPATGPVGPGASHTAEYKVPEYFCFDRFSYAEAEVEMAKYRLPQPSAVTK